VPAPRIVVGWFAPSMRFASDASGRDFAPVRGSSDD
jgi:hypothetical protein